MFLFGKKKQSKPTVQPSSHQPTSIDKESAWLRRKLEEQDKQLSKIKQAEEKYKEDEDIKALLDFWQGIWDLDGGLKFNGNHWLFRYPELLIKEKRYDEAWAILNRMSIEKPEHLSRIRDMQYKILKKEGKGYLDAIFFLMSSVLLNMGSTYNPLAAFDDGEKSRFVKKALPLAKKAGWNATDVDYLVHLLEVQIKKKSFNEDSLSKAYQKFLEEKKA